MKKEKKQTDKNQIGITKKTKKLLSKSGCEGTTRKHNPVVYKTTNVINGKFYIGKDVYNNNSYLGSGMILKQAIKKHGKENFKKEILEHCTVENADEQEVFWIKKLNAIELGYNITNGGAGGDTISNNPNKERIREKMRGKIPANKGIPMSDDQKKLCSESQKQRFADNPEKRRCKSSFKPGKDHVLYGKQRDPTIVAKIAKSNREAFKKYCKPVKILFIESNETIEYESLSEAARQTGISQWTLSERSRSKSGIYKKKYKIELC